MKMASMTMKEKFPEAEHGDVDGVQKVLQTGPTADELQDAQDAERTKGGKRSGPRSCELDDGDEHDDSVEELKLSLAYSVNPIPPILSTSSMKDGRMRVAHLQNPWRTPTDMSAYSMHSTRVLMRMSTVKKGPNPGVQLRLARLLCQVLPRLRGGPEVNLHVQRSSRIVDQHASFIGEERLRFALRSAMSLRCPTSCILHRFPLF